MSGVPCSLRSNLANHQKAFSSSKSCRMAFWAHCTLSRMISYLLLLNEHKKTLRFWFRVSMTQLQYIIITTHPYFITPFFLWKSKDQHLYSPCTWFLHLQGKKNMMPAEPGALIKYMRTQICTFCQSGGGFPTETRGWVSQNLNMKYSLTQK